MLDYERLDVYRAAIQFTEVAFRLIDLLPKGNASLADQLRQCDCCARTEFDRVYLGSV